MYKFILLTILYISFKVNADSKCSEFTPVSTVIDSPEVEWMAVLMTVPKGHTTKFCLTHRIKLFNATAAMVDATKDGETAQFLLTIPEETDSISQFDLHLYALPDPPPLQKTFYLAHFKYNHYYCFIQCSMNYDLYDDFVACFTTQRSMSEEDRKDVDGFVEKLGFQMNNKNDTVHVDITDC